MELIQEVPPIDVDARIAACEGGTLISRLFEFMLSFCLLLSLCLSLVAISELVV